MAAPKTTLTVRVEDELKDWLVQEAKKDGRTPSNLVAFILSQHYADEKRGSKFTRQDERKADSAISISTEAK